VAITVIQGDEEFFIEKASKDESNSSLSDKKIYLEYSEYLEQKDIRVIGSESVCYIVRNCEDLKLPETKDDETSYIFEMKLGTRISDISVSRCINVNKLKVTSSKNEVFAWILEEGERLNIDLSRVVGALFVNCGNRPRKIYSELLKLKTLVGSGTVTPEQVKCILSFSAELNPKSIIDAISNGKTSLALSFYDRLQEKGDETGWILSYLHNFVLQLLKVKLMQSLNRTNVQESLSLNPFIYNNHILPHLNKWTLNSLKASCTSLADIDLMNKRGSMISEYMLESEIIRLSEEASKTTSTVLT